MKICFISDTHGYHNNIKIPECDILVSCGDHTVYGEIWEVKKFLIWFGNLPHKNKYFINGNHEVQVWRRNLTKQMVKEHNRNFLTSIIYLEEEEVVIEGLKFWGSPYTPEFFDWAYMYNRADGKKRWENIPDDTDIIITHGPPAGILDAVKPFGKYKLPYAGCDDLMNKVKKIKPKVHVFGHIHTHPGFIKRGETLFINASTCNDRYVPVHPPIVVDTENWEVVND